MALVSRVTKVVCLDTHDRAGLSRGREHGRLGHQLHAACSLQQPWPETDNQFHGLTSGDRAKLSAARYLPSPNATGLHPSSGGARAPVCVRRDCGLIHVLLMYYGGQTNIDGHIPLFMDTKSRLMFCSKCIPSRFAFLFAKRKGKAMDTILFYLPQQPRYATHVSGSKQCRML